MSLPAHLRKYVVEQNYEKYTALDHAVWRYILRQLKSFLGRHAHESYLAGLEKTGIEIDQIPRIENISAHLEKFGWRAVPVSGFIPPAAFMELQSLNVLPIASDMRSLDHLLYTPAPDIVHEAAGHAPIIANPEYAAYLRQYAQVAKKSIISKEDIEMYRAIRELSDIKEKPDSTEAEITKAENHLNQVSKSISFTSEASKLSRMNWWTAEYGLIGDIQNPKIFGAGLLSSVGESQWCLSEKVRKIPLELNCIEQNYDITEPQPQLFVARDFKHLADVLSELADTMAYRIGGAEAVKRAIQAESVNTVELDSGVQISGALKKYYDANGEVAYLQFQGPTQICFNGEELKGHGSSYHREGYGTPLGEVTNLDINELKTGEHYELNYKSGVKVSGHLQSTENLILSFADATCEFRGEILFHPEWGAYDIVIGHKVTSVFGGPADRVAYGDIEDFVAQRVSQPTHSAEQKKKFNAYQTLRDLRNSGNFDNIQNFFKELQTSFPNEWLLFLEFVEMGIKNNIPVTDIENHLKNIAATNEKVSPLIYEGLKLAHEKF